VRTLLIYMAHFDHELWRIAVYLHHSQTLLERENGILTCGEMVAWGKSLETTELQLLKKSPFIARSLSLLY